MTPKGPLKENRKSPPERVLFAMKCLSEMRANSAMRAIMEQFGVGRSSAKRAMAMARHVMMEEEEELRPSARAMIIGRLYRLADRAEDVGDYSASVRALRELAQIYGLRAPEEVTVRLDADTAAKLEDLTDEQLRAFAAMKPKESKTTTGKPTEH